MLVEGQLRRLEKHNVRLGLARGVGPCDNEVEMGTHFARLCVYPSEANLATHNAHRHRTIFMPFMHHTLSDVMYSGGETNPAFSELQDPTDKPDARLAVPVVEAWISSKIQA